MPDFPHAQVAIDVHHIDREFHEEGVDRFAGLDPHACAWFEACTAEQTAASLMATASDMGCSREHHTTRQIADFDGQASGAQTRQA